MDRLIYPTDDVPMTDLVRAALAECGATHVAVVSGAGAQAVRVPEDCADRVEVRAGLREQEPPHPPPSANKQAASSRSGDAETASGSEVGSAPGPDAPNRTTAEPTDTQTPGRPAARPAARAAKKTTTTTRRATRRKEG